MNRTRDLATVAGCVLVAALVALAGADGGARIASVPVIVVCAAAAFIINWIAFVPALLRRTERFYDLTGSITYLTLVAVVLLSVELDPTTTALALVVSVWTIRLGTFLFARVQRAGGDGRFDAIVDDPARFFMTWTLQGLWVFLTMCCALAAMTAVRRVELGWLSLVGVALWCVGFGIEVVADEQKRRFHDDAHNDGRFITTGLWAWSRHPNYFGEIVVWVGVAVVSLPALSGWQYVTLISPLFVTVLLTRVSGVPMLEARGRRRWGDDPGYRAYVERTPVLVPRPPRAG